MHLVFIIKVVNIQKRLLTCFRSWAIGVCIPGEDVQDDDARIAEFDRIPGEIFDGGSVSAPLV